MVSRECILATKTIKMYGVDRQYQNLKREVLDITDTVLSTGRVLDGEYTIKFELAMANRLNRRYAVCVNSATTGLVFALNSLVSSEKPGLLIPAVSYIATINVATLSKYTNLQICDIDSSGLIDLGKTSHALGSDINTVMSVSYTHLTLPTNREV